MSTVQERLGGVGPEISHDETTAGTGTTGQNVGFNIDFLLQETGPGPIDDYVNDPMNFDHSPEMAQIVRGVNGFGMRSNLAIFDILFGLIRLFRRQKKNEKQADTV